MNLQELRALLQELMAAVEQVLASGEELPDDLQMQLAQTFSLLMDRYEEASQRGAAPVVPKMDQAMPSSNVEGFAYDPKAQKLFVRFLGQYPDRNGPVYSYDGVPHNIFNLFRHGMIPAKTNGQNQWGRWWKGKFPSIGAAMYQLIKQRGFPYQRVA